MHTFACCLSLPPRERRRRAFEATTECCISSDIGALPVEATTDEKRQTHERYRGSDLQTRGARENLASSTQTSLHADGRRQVGCTINHRPCFLRCKTKAGVSKLFSVAKLNRSCKGTLVLLGGSLVTLPAFSLGKGVLRARLAFPDIKVDFNECVIYLGKKSTANKSKLMGGQGIHVDDILPHPDDSVVKNN